MEDGTFQPGDKIIDDRGREGEIDGTVDECGYIEVVFYDHTKEWVHVHQLEYND